MQQKADLATQKVREAKEAEEKLQAETDAVDAERLRNAAKPPATVQTGASSRRMTKRPQTKRARSQLDDDDEHDDEEDDEESDDVDSDEDDDDEADPEPTKKPVASKSKKKTTKKKKDKKKNKKSKKDEEQDEEEEDADEAGSKRKKYKKTGQSTAATNSKWQNAMAKKAAAAAAANKATKASSSAIKKSAIKRKQLVQIRFKDTIYNATVTEVLTTGDSTEQVMVRTKDDDATIAKNPFKVVRLTESEASAYKKHGTTKDKYGFNKGWANVGAPVDGAFDQ